MAEIFCANCNKDDFMDISPNVDKIDFIFAFASFDNWIETKVKQK